MTTKQESRPAPVQLKVHYQHQHSTPTIYADGLSQIQIGFPNSRLLLLLLKQRGRRNKNISCPTDLDRLSMTCLTRGPRREVLDFHLFFSLEEIDQAHALMENNEANGKIVIVNK